MKNVLIIMLVITVSSVTSISLSAQGEAIIPVRCDSPVVIDGLLDEAVWQNSEKFDAFITYDPDFGKEMPFGTVAMMSYDESNLYFAFRCFDPEPDKIKASIDSRDNILNDDWVCINLDSFNDQQGLYTFYINPYGIQMDCRFVAGKEDVSLDYVWYSAGKTDKEGYIVEIQIPLKSIRYSKGDPVTMGIILERKISRMMVHGTFPALDPEQGWSFQTQMMPVELSGVKHFSLFELLPAVTYSNRKEQSEGELISTENKAHLSMTTKFSITPQLVMDATINPDFSQVESDAGQIDINLRYQIYYPEKRPFFQEGSENFKAGATSSSELDPVRSLVHTRTIINPVAGAKISGKAGIKNSLSLIYAADRTDPTAGFSPEGLIHFPVVRYKRSLRDDSFVGTLYTGRFSPEGFNHVAGVDGVNRLNKSTQIEYQMLYSSSAEEESEKRGSAAGIYLHSEKRDMDYAFTAKNITEGFSSEAGYITRTGISYATGLLKPKIYPGSHLVRRIDLEFFTGQIKDNIYDMWETFNHISALARIGNSSQFKVKYSYSTEIFRGEKFHTGGFHILLSSQISKSLTSSILYRNRGSIYYSETPYQGRSNNITAGITFLPSDKLHTDLYAVFQDFRRSSNEELVYQYLITRGTVTYQANKYLFARAIAEYNNFRKELLTDFLISFTYIPGTVLHIGYGSIYNKMNWDGSAYQEADSFIEMNRGLFVKASYLHRF
ncbi:MAG: carbohydrate binding family 9 domain-containing protein [Bacteroidales bacterium]|nr:carbohydrate binding family 9 domain-containing protein [Bacteroidales bacterium]